MLQTSTATTIIGIDPGYDRVGWGVGVVKGAQIAVKAYGCIETDRTKTLIERFQQIDCQLEEIIKIYQPTEAAVETLFFSVNKTTAMHVSEARGVIISVLFRHGVEFAEYNPVQIKQTVTGHGQADKKAVEKMVRLQLGLNEMRKDEKKVLDDTLDALGIMITHAASRKMKQKP